MEKTNNLGIPSSGFEYQNLLEGQDPLSEFLKTSEFLTEFFNKELYNYAPELYSDDMQLQFINYGDTQLVYVFQSGSKQYTVLVGQPAIEKGIVKKEFDNLQKLSKDNKDIIVKPDYYYTNNERELYITPYLFQARCIASQEHGWGIYIPEPFYRFEHFNSIEQYYVNVSIIANLIRLYNDKDKSGIASCKIGGGDFILEKEWSYEEKNLENTLKRVKLIAARELIKISLESYIELIKKEFSVRTYYKNLEQRDTSILINHKSRIPMKEKEIEEGIKLGLKLRKR